MDRRRYVQMKSASCILLLAAIVFASGCKEAGNGRHHHDTGRYHDPARDEDENESESREKLAFFVKERIRHEVDILKDPVTGKIPFGIREKELRFATTIPSRLYNNSGGGAQGIENLNTYALAGPDNAGGRTRAVAFDLRFGTSNQVIIAGSVSGGIFRSTDAGANWTRVNPENDIHNLTSLAQSPLSPDTWYAAGGEPIGNSASGPGAAFLGFGIWKSTNNGATWSKLTAQVTDIDGSTVLGAGALETFDNPFDFIHKILVHPVTGDVYICGHRRLIRSTNGGTSWNVVFTGTTATTSDIGQMDIAATNQGGGNGKLYLAVNGALPDTDKRGIWTSTTGNANSWTRIAGGNTLNVDSVAAWKGNDYSGNSRRILVTPAPSSQNIVYVTYENGQDHSGSSGKAEVDLFKLDVTSGSNVWTNLSANVPDFPGQMDGVDPFLTQGGYDLMLKVKPDDANAVFLGGVNLFRSTNGFSTTAATSWIGGYGKGFTSGLNIYGSVTNGNDFSKWSHPDMHNLAFDPSNPNRAISANDGGVQLTENIMGTANAIEPVDWTVLANYQTLQFYYVAIDPEANRNNFIGGAQDNGTRFRDATGVLGAPSGNSHYRVLGGDGGAAAIAKAGTSSQIVYCTVQFGDIRRVTLSSGNITSSSIRPSGLTATPGIPGSFGDFVTYFKLDFDNTEDLYYVNFNRLFRTTTASTVTASSWQELTGVRSAVNPTSPTNGTDISISALESSRGTYAPSHVLYIGTSNGRVFRLNDPHNATPATAPADITPTQIRDHGYIIDIAANPNNDEEIMVVASNYQYTNSSGTAVNTINIWWTNNAKSATPTWKNAEGNLTLPSARSCVIAVKKDALNNSVTEYYVGTSVGLYSAVNIGTTLQSGGTVNWVREGGDVLNYAVIVSLSYRPQDNTLLVGTHGNGMYSATLGTPDFRPNANTGINDPVRNDKNFIQIAYPTVAHNNIDFLIGNMFTVKRLAIKVFTVNGQLAYSKESGYENGTIDVGRLSKGAYILTITSQDNKQQFVQKFVKD